MLFEEVRIEVATDCAEHIAQWLCERSLPFQQCDRGTLNAPPPGKTRFHLYLQEEQARSLPELLSAVQQLVPDKNGMQVEQTQRDDSEWRDTWKQHFATRRIGRFAIVPSWEMSAHRPQTGEITLLLDPGRAFGTGGHASTRLCLHLLDRMFEYPQTHPALAKLYDAKKADEKAAVVDVGCGCGVLLLAALKLFPHRRGVGLDIDPEAVAVSQENAARNDLSDRLVLTEKSLAQLSGEHVLLLANLTAQTLGFWGKHLARRTEVGGLLIASGILSLEADEPIASFENKGFGLVEHAQEDEWSGLLLQKRGLSGPHLTRQPARGF